MPNPTYLTSCPKCGRELEPHAGHPEATPWTCHHCGVGFWVAELTPEARQRYRPLFHDWGVGPEADAIRDAVERERTEAMTRGTSARHEHLGLLGDEHLGQLQRLLLSEEFAAHVQQARDS